MKKLYLFSLATLATSSAFAAPITRNDIGDVSWSDASSWTQNKEPESTDDVQLLTSVTTYSDEDVTINNVRVGNDATLDISAGTFKVNGQFYHNKATINLSGTAAVNISSKEYNFGEVDDYTGAGVFNAEGNSSLTLSANGAAFRIGYNAVNDDFEANFYGESTFKGRLKIGSETAGSTAKSTLKAFGSAKLNIDYMNFFQNAILEVSEKAQVNASADMRWHDMTASTAGSVVIKDYASLSARAIYAGDGTTITVQNNASLSTTTANENFYLGADYNKVASGNAHLVLKDSATLNVAQNLMMVNGSTFTLEGSKVTAKLTAIGGGISTADSKIIFKSDATGISKITSRYAADTNSIEVDNVGFLIEMDFSNLALAEGTYTFDVITLTENANREKAIIKNYADYSDQLISVLTKNKGDSYDFIVGGDNNLTLSMVYTVVPEPSTYAMIFGTLAFAFVAYRRRK